MSEYFDSRYALFDLNESSVDDLIFMLEEFIQAFQVRDRVMGYEVEGLYDDS